MARKDRPYHVLALRHEGGLWGVAFGDYDAQTVKDERADYRQQGYKASALVMFKAPNGRQSSVDAGIAALNSQGAN